MAWGWELVWMLVILKIPLIYLCVVLWWALRGERRPLEPAPRTIAAEIGPQPGWRFLRAGPRRPRRGPHGSPRRSYVRGRAARAAVQR